MSTEDLDLDGSERESLEALLRTDGWRRYVAMIEAEWGDSATLRKIQKAVAVAPLGDQEAVTDATQHVLAQQRAILALVEWPKQRIAALAEDKPSRRPFDALRRIGR